LVIEDKGSELEALGRAEGGAEQGPGPGPGESARRFHIVTYGCQMNRHDTEKLTNLLYHSGMQPAADLDSADLLVINTCSIRDKAENQLYSDLGKLRDWKERRPARALGVGGCVAQQVGDSLLRRFVHVDFVFGTHNLTRVPAMAEAAVSGERSARVGESDSLDRFDLPAQHPSYRSQSPGRAFVTVMEGCDMFCSFCIVPRTRGREISRPALEIEAEVHRLAERGVVEITLLGQTVNAYGRHDARKGRAQAAGTVPFAKLLRRLDSVPGIERIRYTSPHPLFFDEALVSAHGDLERLCPHVHLPLQSGSDAVLERMRRRYSRRRYLEICEQLRASRADVAITTDLIVGFPGETRVDFEATLDVMREVGFSDCYSFKYSPRPGTSAADLPGSVAPEEAQERLLELQELQRERTLAYHHSRVGGRTRILLEGPSRRGSSQVCGRDPYHRVVNVEAPRVVNMEAPQEGPTGGDGTQLRPGDMLDVLVVAATPHSLIGERLAEATGTAASSGTAGNFSRPAVKRTGQTAEEWKRSGAPPGPASKPGVDPLRVV
jgi:tRNA-2-methylthio-N6-dimethylallyladenosine synthase